MNKYHAIIFQAILRQLKYNSHDFIITYLMVEMISKMPEYSIDYFQCICHCIKKISWVKNVCKSCTTIERYSNDNVRSPGKSQVNDNS